MKKSILTSSFLLGLIGFTLGQVPPKKKITPPSKLQHDNEIIALKKQDLQNYAAFKTSPAFIPLIEDKLISPKIEIRKKVKTVNK